MEENNLSNEENNVSIHDSDQKEVDVNGLVDSEHEDTLNEINREYAEKAIIRKKKNKKSERLQWIQAIVFALILAYLLNCFVFERALVDGPSMEPTLLTNENLFEYKLGYYFHKPSRGDVVIFEYRPGKYKSKFIPLPDPDEKNYVKRVVGQPGDTIDIGDDKFVYVNGQKLIEPYILPEDAVEGITDKRSQVEGEPFQYPYTLKDDEVFVMGDNRTNSTDSRMIGPIKLSRIRGKAISIIFPFNKMKVLEHNSYLEDSK